eukprot:scaffold273_cov242-Pinguiococcus_pyrenoidosus.AAC.35
MLWQFPVTRTARLFIHYIGRHDDLCAMMILMMMMMMMMMMRTTPPPLQSQGRQTRENPQ